MCKGCGRADMAAMVAARSLDTNPNTLPLSACPLSPPFCCYLIIQVGSNTCLTMAVRTGDAQLDRARGWNSERVRSAAPGGVSVPAPNCTVAL